MSEATLQLRIGAARYEGWKKIRVTAGIEQLAGDFELTCADKWAIEGKVPPPLPGKLASITIDGHPVITGFIDDANPSFDPENHELALVGRDLTGDLVDCSALSSGQSLVNRNLQQLATTLCKPFGIHVSVGTGKANGTFAQQAISPGETVFEVLSRAAALRGMLLVSDGLGGLRITQAGTGRAKTPLVLGQNVIGGRGTNSHRDRFHTYRVVSQGVEAIGGTIGFGQQTIASATDPSIRRSRVLTLSAGDAAIAGEAQQLANWTCSNRAARGLRADLDVRGWLDGDKPWQPNTEVYVDVAWLRMKGWFLIAAVTFSLDDQSGQVATITVTPKAAFVPAPEYRHDDLAYYQAQGNS